MSVLNQSGEEQVECPLCMEPLEVDDLNFFPCTCGYQICRFCWHRIRTDENGLCPACRKAYSEDPADFVPLSREQLAQLKAEKRARDQRRKAKLTEGRKHLASVRVVQRNLVFVVGLPIRLADAEVLKRHEYFGKFGKIHKVVINQSTSYAGAQGPSASAYVTYLKSDDALKAIQAVNNIIIDGRLIKSSLGTTKYCSHFMKNQPCPKPDCMYLHEYGDPEASFTKEQMHAGKHQEYEKKLHEELNARTKQNSNNTTNNNNVTTDDGGKTTNGITSNNQKHSKDKEESNKCTANHNNNNKEEANSNGGTNKENWPQLNLECKDKKEKEKNAKKSKTKEIKKDRRDANSKSNSESSTKSDRSINSKIDVNLVINLDEKSPSESNSENSTPPPLEKQNPQIAPLVDDNSSFFSLNGFQKLSQEHPGVTNENAEDATENTQPHSIFTDNLPNINTSEDWEAAFGFSRQNLNEMKRREVKTPHETFTNNFGRHENTYNKETYNGFYEMPNKLPENLLDVLSNKNGFGLRTEQPHQNGIINGLDQNMSKFFTNFQEKVSLPYQNGGFPYPTNAFLEEQMLGMASKSNFPYQNGTAQVQHNHHNPNQGFVNHRGRNNEDELDFDPIQETQKAFEELMAYEGRKGYNPAAGRPQHPNGLVHNLTGPHLPPPPPGFPQAHQNGTHMNSFGSKILPFLNMSSGQQQPPLAGGFWPQQHQPPPQKAAPFSACNDWKVLDPAILSASTRHYPGSYCGAPPQRFDNYGGGGSFGGFPAPQGWYGAPEGAQISSPPGFRSAPTKQQEC